MLYNSCTVRSADRLHIPGSELPIDGGMVRRERKKPLFTGLLWRAAKPM